MVFGKGTLDLTPSSQPFRMKFSKKEYYPFGMIDAVVIDRWLASIIGINVENNIGVFGEIVIFKFFDHLHSFFNDHKLHGVAYLDIRENSLRV